ncbi:MAG: hypothetical protein HQK52_11820 [Oligoflexia bacterium]|nr:hypothetical protein [Oligoflexia bacterium]
MKKYITLLLLFFLFSTPAIIANASDEGYFDGDPGHLPDSWYKLPEDNMANKSLAATAASGEVEAGNPRLSRSFERVMDTNEEIMSRLSSSTTEASDDKTLAPKKHWRLTWISTLFTVSSSGLMGLITGKGTTSLHLWWRKKILPNNKELQPPTESTPTVAISPRMSDSQLTSELEPAIKLALASKKVSDPKKFRDDVHVAAKNFRAVVKDLSNLKSANDRCWWANKFRTDLVLTASGTVMVAPAVTVSMGGEVFVRMEWARLERDNNNKSNSSTGASSDKTELGKFVNAMISNIEKIAATAENENNPIQFNGIRVAIGMSAGGTVHVAKLSGSAIGHLYFKSDVCPNKNLDNKSLTAAVDESIWVEAAARPDYIQLAKSEGIPYKFVPATPSLNGDNKSLMGRALYRVNSARFQNGLKKSVRIARYFTNIITKREEKRGERSKWEIFRVWSGFALSLTGTVGVATVSGISQIELEFNRAK